MKTSWLDLALSVQSGSIDESVKIDLDYIFGD